MNVKNLETVIKLIEQEVMMVQMTDIFSVTYEDAVKNWKDDVAYWNEPGEYIDITSSMTKLPTKKGIGEFGCKTAGCILGHAVVAMPKKSLKIGEDPDMWLTGRKWLGLTEKQAHKLFYSSDWPVWYRQAYDLVKGSNDIKLINSITAARIRHFIATKGRE